MNSESLSKYLCGTIYFPFSTFDKSVKECLAEVFKFEREMIAEAVSLGSKKPGVLTYCLQQQTEKRSLLDRLNLLLAQRVVSKCTKGVDLSVIHPLLVQAFGNSVGSKDAYKCFTDLASGIRVVNCSGQKLALRSAKSSLRSIVIDAGILNTESFASLWKQDNSPRFTVVYLPQGQHWGFPLGFDEDSLSAFDENCQAAQLIRAALRAGADESSLFCFTPIGPQGLDDDDDDGDGQAEPEPDPVLHAG